MQVQKVSAYTGKYSSNNPQQTNSPSFGLSILQNTTIREVVGAKNTSRIIDVLIELMQDLPARAQDILRQDVRLRQTVRNFDPKALEKLSDQLEPSIDTDGTRILAWIADHNDSDCSGCGESPIGQDNVRATIEALTKAFSEWLRAKIGILSMSSKRPPIILPYLIKGNKS